MEKWHVINVKCLRSLLSNNRRFTLITTVCLALPAQSHCNLVYTICVRLHRNAANWCELWPCDTSGRHQKPLYLSLPKTVLSIIQFSLSLTQTHKKPTVFAADRDYRLLDITNFISNVRHKIGSPLMVAYWQGAYALFTNQQRFTQHIIHMNWTNLEFIWMDFDTKKKINN